MQNDGTLFFITGFRGCGKTYLYQALSHVLCAKGIIILCVTSTGLACLLLQGGQTVHSTFKIPIDNLDVDSICSIPRESLWADLLWLARAIIFDECLMIHWHCFEALNPTFQDLRNCPKWFGGLTIVLGEEIFNKSCLSYQEAPTQKWSQPVSKIPICGTICRSWNCEKTCVYNTQ